MLELGVLFTTALIRSEIHANVTCVLSTAAMMKDLVLVASSSHDKAVIYAFVIIGYLIMNWIVLHRL